MTPKTHDIVISYKLDYWCVEEFGKDTVIDTCKNLEEARKVARGWMEHTEIVPAWYYDKGVYYRLPV